MVFLDPYDTQQLPMGVIRLPPPQDFAANKNVFRLISRPQLDQPVFGQKKGVSPQIVKKFWKIA